MKHRLAENQPFARKVSRTRTLVIAAFVGSLGLAALAPGAALAIPSAEVPEAVKTVSFAGPIIITRGGTYSGNWQSGDPNTPAITVRTSEPVVIENATLLGRGHLIRVSSGYGANVTVRNVQGYGLNPNVQGRVPGRFLHADDYRRVIVENSYMESTAGIFFHQSRTGATVKLLRNQAKNIDGRISNGRGGWEGDAAVRSTFNFAQFVQFNKGNDLVDTEISWNEIINEPYKSRPEDVVNFYRTSGTAGSPIKVHNNYIEGAYPVDPGRDSFTGGGIIIGDFGGGYVHAFENQVVSTSNYGIAIAGGVNSRMDNNRVISCGYLADGTRIASQNVGLYIWKYSVDFPFENNTGSGNLSGWNKGNARNDWWIPDASAWNGNMSYSPSGLVPCSAERAEYDRWRTKVQDAGVVVGIAGNTLAPPMPPVLHEIAD